MTDTVTARLAGLLGGLRVRIGLRQQGHYDRVTEMRAAGASWDDIGRAIGWHGPTVAEWYEAESRPAPPAVPR